MKIKKNLCKQKASLSTMIYVQNLFIAWSQLWIIISKSWTFLCSTCPFKRKFLYFNVLTIRQSMNRQPQIVDINQKQRPITSYLHTNVRQSAGKPVRWKYQISPPITTQLNFPAIGWTINMFKFAISVTPAFHHESTFVCKKKRCSRLQPLHKK